MMNKAYLAISRSNRQHLATEVEMLKTILKSKHIDLMVFVDEYSFAPNEERAMMRTAFAAIEQADFLIAEGSKKAVGVGIEVGYAYAIGKPILYLRKEDSPYSTTIAGCANFSTTHEANNLEQVLAKLLT